MQNRISIKDIAKITGTSITTVSFVINGKAKEKSISDEVAQRIQKAVSELGYKPNALARGLRTGKSKIIGFLVDDISKPFFSKIATSIDQIASRNGYKIIFSSIGKDLEQAKEVLEIFNERQVDGYIIAITAGADDMINSVLDSPTPVVFFDRFIPEIAGDYVLVDNYNSTVKATKHLLENDFSNIAFVTTNSSEQQLVDRLKGYYDAVKVAERPQYILKIDYINQQEATPIIKDFLMQHTEIDAVIFATNYLTMDGLQLLKTSDQNLLANKGLISFDDFELLEFLKPTITAIEQPAQAIAEHIMEILFTKLKGSNDETGKIHRVIELPTKLNIRQSSIKT